MSLANDIMTPLLTAELPTSNRHNDHISICIVRCVTLFQTKCGHGFFLKRVYLTLLKIINSLVAKLFWVNKSYIYCKMFCNPILLLAS